MKIPDHIKFLFSIPQVNIQDIFLPEKISKLKTHNKELNITPINFYPLNKLYSMILENLDSICQSRYPEIKSTATFIFSQCNKNAL